MRRFRNSSHLLSLLALGLTVLCAGCADRKSQAPRAVFLIVVDTLRADRLSCYGYDRPTPNLDRLATRGVRFSNAYSAASWTLPSMGAMMSSTYPTQLGLVEVEAPADTLFEAREQRDQRFHTPRHSARMMAEILSDNGYHATAFVNQPVLNFRRGFLQGFDEWFYPKPPAEFAQKSLDVQAQQRRRAAKKHDAHTIVRHNPREPITPARWEPAMIAAGIIEPRLVSEFEAWLPAHKDEPLFAWLHLLTPHKPYNPVGEFRPQARPGQEVTDSDRYDAEVAHADAMIGDIIAAIDANVGLDNALIVVTSDHGEEFLEHGYEGHGHSLHREVTNVPLILAGMGLPHDMVIDEPVRGIDLLPSIMDIAGINVTTEATVQGASLLPLTRGESLILPVYCEGMLFGPTQRALLSGHHRTIYSQQLVDNQLFDLTTDAAEMNNLAEAEPEVSAKMRSALDQFYDRLSLTALEADVDDAERAEALKVLRSLGYIND